MGNVRIFVSAAAAAAGFVIAAAPSEARASTSILVSVHDQKLALVRDGERVAEYRISTSRFGLGDRPRSYATPLGKLEIADRVGDGLQPGAVLKGRAATGEILPTNARGRDPIVTRILHLRGLEERNQNAFRRGIYIHGTPVERTLGKPDSWGCIRMRSKDIIALFDSTPVGTVVEIIDEPIRRVLPGMLAATRPFGAPAPVAEPPAIGSGVTGSSAVASAAPAAPFIQSEHRRLASNALPGRRLATAQEERRAAERPQHMHFGMASLTELRSLGGIDQLRETASRETRERRSGAGLSLAIW